MIYVNHLLKNCFSLTTKICSEGKTITFCLIDGCLLGDKLQRKLKVAVNALVGIDFVPDSVPVDLFDVVRSDAVHRTVCGLEGTSFVVLDINYLSALKLSFDPANYPFFPTKYVLHCLYHLSFEF